MPVTERSEMFMKKVVVLLWVWLYWLARSFGAATKLVWQEVYEDMAPYVGKVTLLKSVAALCLGVTGIGVLGVFLAVMK